MNWASPECLPDRLKHVINQIAEGYGALTIMSTHRSRQHNARVGGASRSMHLQCQAVDFMYYGGKTRDLMAFLVKNRAVGGYKKYGGSGHIHIDTGPRRTW